MKKVGKYILITILGIGIIYAAIFFISTNNQSATKFEVETPISTSIEKKTVATGKVVPEDQVEIKPQVSGIIENVLVKEGDVIKTGDLIATIKVVPNEASLNSAIGRVENAKIVLENTKIEYDRTKTLFDKKVVSTQEFNGVELKYNQAKQEVVNANNDLQIIKLGTAGKGSTNTNIRATISGTILEIQVKKGDQVIESNNFNPGTTIAIIADLSNMIFEGKVDEAEVANLKIGMPLQINLGAISDKSLEAKLRFVSPQGIEEQGAVQFKIEAVLSLDSSFFVRAGYSANATIVLGKTAKVLAIREALVQYDEETEEPFVEVEIGEQKFERKNIELGISDGINVEIKSGITASDKVKVWSKTEPMKKTEEKK